MIGLESIGEFETKDGGRVYVVNDTTMIKVLSRKKDVKNEERTLGD